MTRPDALGAPGSAARTAVSGDSVPQDRSGRRSVTRHRTPDTSAALGSRPCPVPRSRPRLRCRWTPPAWCSPATAVWAVALVVLLLLGDRVDRMWTWTCVAAIALAGLGLWRHAPAGPAAPRVRPGRPKPTALLRPCLRARRRSRARRPSLVRSRTPQRLRPSRICGQASDLGIRAGAATLRCGRLRTPDRRAWEVSWASWLSALDALAADDLHALPAGAQLRPHRASWCGPATGSTPSSPARVRVAELHPGARARRAEVDGAPGCAGTAGSPRPRRASSSRTGRALEHLPPWPPPSPPGRSPPTRSRCSPRSPPRRTWPPPPSRASTSAEVDAVLAESAATRAARCSWAGWCTTTWPASTPTGPNPTPPRAARCPSPSTPTAACTGRVRPRRGRRGEGRRRCSSRSSQADRPRRGHRTRAQQLGDALVQAGRPRPRLRSRCRSCAPSSRTSAVLIGIADLVDPAAGPDAAHHRLRGGDLRRPRPLAGLRRQRQPDRHRPRRPCRWTSAAPSGSSRRTCAAPSNCATSTCVFTGCQAPAYWCDVHHVLHWARRRRDLPGELARCSANGTTPRSTTASGSNEHPDGRWHTYRPDGTENPHRTAAHLSSALGWGTESGLSRSGRRSPRCRSAPTSRPRPAR